MPGTFTVNLDRPVKSAGILHDYQVGVAERTGLVEDLQTEKNRYGEACLMLEGAAGKLNRFYDEAVAGHKDEIAGLSVEIARKVLARKVADGDYEIEAIVKEALENAPAHEGIVIRVNPQDLASCQKAWQDDDSGAPVGVKLVSDQNIGRAECVLESPKGVIKSLIDAHLEQIGKALEKAE